MTDDSLLRRKLARLADNVGEFANGARVLGQAGASDLVQTVLDEIDDTVLTSALTVSNSQAFLRFVVSDRRVMGLSAASDGMPGADALQGVLLSADDTPQMEQVAALVQSLVMGTGQLTIHSAPTKKLGGPSDAGIATATLGPFWRDIAPSTATPADDDFFSSAANVIPAYIFEQNGETERAFGDDGMLQMLRGVLEADQSQLEAYRNAEQAGTLTLLDDVLIDGTGLGIVGNEDGLGLFAYKTSGSTEVLSSWRRAK